MTRKNIYIAAVTSAVLITCPVTRAADDTTLNLRPGKVHESCHKLAAGNKLNYSFQTSSLTLFNIHFHIGKQLNYPVKEQLLDNSSGTVDIDTAQTYCLMWTNSQSHTVTLRYDINLSSR